MTNYKTSINPFTGHLQLLFDTSILIIKGSVATTGDLPLSGNSQNDCYVVQADDRMYTWNSSSSTGLITDWVDIASVSSIDWSGVTNKPSSSVSNIDDAVSKKHTQGTDQGLDTGGANEVTAAQAKAGYTHSGVTSGNPHAVSKSDVGLGNVDNKSEATIITDVKADSDVADAISKKHTQGTDQALDTGGANEITASNAKAAYTHSQVSSGNPHNVSKSDVSLGNVTNDAQVKKASSSTDDYLPKWVGASGDELEDSSVSESDAADAISKKHTRSHAIDSGSDHTSSITENNLIDADSNGLPDDSGLSVSDTSDAISKKHTQNTDTILDNGGSNEVSAAEVVKNIYNTMLLAFKLAIQGSLTIFNMIDGIVDEYEDESGVDTANSSNESYDSTNDLYNPTVTQLLTSHLTGTQIEDFSGRETLANDGVTAANAANSSYKTAATDMYSGKDWGAGVTRTITGFKAYGSTDEGFVHGASPTVTATLQGSTDNFSGSIVDLGDVSATDSAGLMLSKMSGLTTSTAYRYHRIKISWSGSSTAYFAEAEFYEDNLDTSPYAHYKMNDDAANTTVTDTGTGSNNGTASANTSTFSTTGKINESLDFQQGQYIDVDALESDIGADTTGSFSFWINPDVSNYYTIFAFGDTDADTYIESSVSTNYGLIFAIKLTGSDIIYARTNNYTITQSTWNHVAVVQDGTELKIYINGALSTINWDAFSDKGGWFDDVAGVDNGRIGCRNYNNGGNANHFDGRIDDFRYYQSKPLTSAEVAAIYNSGNGTEADKPVITDNMTLISNSVTAESQPDDARVVIFEEDVDSITINTDLTVEISRDGGSNYSTVTLSDEGDYASGQRILVGNVDISGQPAGTSIEYRLKTLNNKDCKIHGISVLWS